MNNELILRSSLTFISLMFLFYLMCKERQRSDLSWAMFYASLWVLLSLLVSNWILVHFNFWHFPESKGQFSSLPSDLLFVWVVLWGVVVPFVFKGSKMSLAALIVFWIDVLYMPFLERIGIVQLSSYWLWGELILLGVVFLPSFVWSQIYLKQTRTGVRSLFQLVCMAIIIALILPFGTLHYFSITPQPLLDYVSLSSQCFFIILLPSFIAVIDLSEKGQGTPFPYDPTKRLVRTGVYAYIRNPIQWSLTLVFIPLAIVYSSPMLLLGVVVSVAYTYGVSNFHEFQDMNEKHGAEWEHYKQNVPAWFFLWKPTDYPHGTIYFNNQCNACRSMRDKLKQHQAMNLVFRHTHDYKGKTLLQVTYVDHYGNISTSVKAIANALEHINLAWATLGWLMRMPGVAFVLQAIVDVLDFEKEEKGCPL